MKTLLGILAFALMLCTAALRPASSAEVKTAPVQDIRSNTDHTITPEMIIKAVKKGLEEAGAGKDIDVKLFGTNREAAYAYSSPITLKVEELKYDNKAGTFTATLNFESEGQALAPSQINGRYDEMVNLPTLKRRLFQGDIIAEDDIAISRTPSARLRKGTILDSAQLIGRAPVKMVSANRPVLLTDITSPALVKKGDQITLRYLSKNLSINTVGEALDDGAVGDRIRVKNTTSNKVVQAEIKARDLATVQDMIQTDDGKQ